MHLQGRQARQADFAEAGQLIADRSLYGSSDIAALFEMWQHVIDDEAGFASVVVGEEPSPLLAFGLSVALKRTFVETLFDDPKPFIAARMLQAWRRGDSPFMTRDEVAEANAGWGIDVFVLHHGYAPMKDEGADYAVRMALAAEFVRQHAGLNLRSLIQEFYDRSWLDMCARFGFSVRRDFIDHPSAAQLPPDRRPFLADVRRSAVLAADRGDFPTNTLFVRFPAPRLNLEPEQRKLVRGALEEEIDAQPEGDPRWEGIFERMARVDSSILAAAPGDPQRRSRAVAWLRSHPEELHPYRTV